ncbi:30S ribosomal protein S9 [Candidatus Woesearchaeota archaeon]|nr:30S ribosomal protein S9 [Candidatus Woesearchaeota archaeon]
MSEKKEEKKEKKVKAKEPKPKLKKEVKKASKKPVKKAVKKQSVKKEKNIHASGKRKTAIARATLRVGTGKIRINSKLLDSYQPRLAREKILEAIKLSQVRNVDINVKVIGGGIMGQAEAARLAISRALVEHTPSLKKTFLDYDRNLLVADVRRKEPSKPNSHGKARAKRQKSYR